jgi:DNA-binding MarR family transcriptional regulator
MNMQPETAERAQRLVEVFSRLVAELITNRALREATDGELSRTQFAGLRFIRCHAGCALQDLAAGLDVSHPAALKLFERLNRKGLVKRDTARDDRRRAELRLSPRGEEVLAAIRERQTRCVRHIIDEMPTEAAGRLAPALSAFIYASLDNPEIVERACLQCGREHEPSCILHQARLRFRADEHGGESRATQEGPAD